MDKIEVKQLTEEELTALDIGSWSPWECEPSTFDWEYTDRESAYVKEGKVQVEANGETVEIKAGDFVIFPKGLQCKWHVLETIRKVYKFG